MPGASKAIAYQAFIRSFAKEKLSRLYFIYGTEEYLKKKAVDMIIDRAIPVEVRDFDLVTFYGDDCDVSSVLDAASSDPFMAKDKVVLLRKFDSLKTVSQQKIIDYLSQNELFNFIILTADSLDNRLKIAKQINKIGVVVHCRSPYKPEDMIPWLHGEVGAHDKTIASDAAQLFVNRVELDYMIASNELEKLLLYTVNSNKITVSDVQMSTGYSRSFSVFDLINAVGERDPRQTFIVIENLMDNKESAVFLITMLLRFFVQLWKINSLQVKGMTEREILSKHLTEIYHLYRKDYIRYAQKYPLASMPLIFKILLETDTELKSLNLEDALIVERMLFRIFAAG